MSNCSSYGDYLNYANCDGTPAVHSACTACVNHGDEFHEYVNCKLHELHTLVSPTSCGFDFTIYES